jgi:hypothetical protein
LSPRGSRHPSDSLTHNGLLLLLFDLPLFLYLHPKNIYTRKYQIHSGLVGITKDQVKMKVGSAMKIIQKRPGRVKKYFEDPAISHAS